RQEFLSFVYVQRTNSCKKFLASWIGQRGIENINFVVIAGVGSGVFIGSGNLNIIFPSFGDNKFQIFDIVDQLDHARLRHLGYLSNNAFAKPWFRLPQRAGSASRSLQPTPVSVRI